MMEMIVMMILRLLNKFFQFVEEIKTKMREVEVQMTMLKARWQVVSDSIYEMKCEIAGMRREINSAT